MQRVYVRVMTWLARRGLLRGGAAGLMGKVRGVLQEPAARIAESA